MFANMQAYYYDVFGACDCNTMQKITPRERCLHVQVRRGAAGGRLQHVAETYGGGEEAWVVSFPCCIPAQAALRAVHIRALAVQCKTAARVANQPEGFPLYMWCTPAQTRS